MKQLSIELDRYLSIRRSLGYSLVTTEKVLRAFVLFMEQDGSKHINIACFMRWKESYGNAGRQTWSRRLGIIRLFAQWLHCSDPRHEIPPQALVPYYTKRTSPYIYTKKEIQQIIETAEKLPSRNGTRGITYSTLFGLVAVTGLRISEAVSLDNADVNLDEGVIFIRQGKYGKERLLPLSGSTVDHLQIYAITRERLLAPISTPAFFVSDYGARITAISARYNFAKVGQKIGLRKEGKCQQRGSGPRIHDLRHTFAVRTLIDWYRSEKDVSCEMIKLTTYMGHSLPSNTYWYLDAAPELLELACRRAEQNTMQEVKS